MRHYFYYITIGILLLGGCARAGVNKDGSMWFNGIGRAKFSETQEIESKPMIELPRIKIEE